MGQLHCDFRVDSLQSRWSYAKWVIIEYFNLMRSLFLLLLRTCHVLVVVIVHCREAGQEPSVGRSIRLFISCVRVVVSESGHDLSLHSLALTAARLGAALGTLESTRRCTWCTTCLGDPLGHFIRQGDELRNSFG